MIVTDIVALKQAAMDDLTLDKTELDKDALRIPSLYAKWLNIHVELLGILKKARRDYDKLYLERLQYYNGSSTNPSPTRVMKADLPTYIKADPQYVQAGNDLDHLETCVTLVEKTMDQIKNMSFQIKNAIEWRRFLSGQG